MGRGNTMRGSEVHLASGERVPATDQGPVDPPAFNCRLILHDILISRKPGLLFCPVAAIIPEQMKSAAVTMVRLWIPCIQRGHLNHHAKTASM